MTTRTKRQTIAVMVAPFDIKELRELMSYDELELDLVGERSIWIYHEIEREILNRRL
mgnify:CR=1 FL=1